MTQPDSRLAVEDLQRNLREVQELLHQHASREGHETRAAAPAEGALRALGSVPQLAELRARLDQLHAADVAGILEGLPQEERLVAWALVRAEREGEILLELSDAVRESLIASMEPRELVAATGTLEADEIADLLPDLPEQVAEDVIRALPQEEREQLRAAMAYEEGTVGALMDFDQVSVRDDVTLEAVTRYLRRMDQLPAQTDQLFVIGRDQRLAGNLPLARLIVSDLALEVGRVMSREGLQLHPEDAAEKAAQAFERYDLVSAPVVDHFGRLIGRLTVNAVVDYTRHKSAQTQLAESGLREQEDVFAPVWHSFRNRWAWLAVNLVTAFIASRVIGAFEGSIEKLVALAALMPIVAGVGGNSGNQTITMIVRALALGQIHGEYWVRLLRKELSVATLNGVTWGTLLGAATYLLYGNLALAGVMGLAMVLNLLLAAGMGVAIPYVRAHFGRDPAAGASVLITACTDSGGFFIFLGLATLMLL